MSEEICEWYQSSRIQRESELKRGLGDRGTKAFEKMGCYECDGRNPDCPSYYLLGMYSVVKNYEVEDERI